MERRGGMNDARLMHQSVMHCGPSFQPESLRCTESEGSPGLERASLLRRSYGAMVYYTIELRYLCRQ